MTPEQGSEQLEGRRPVTIWWKTMLGMEYRKSKSLEVGNDPGVFKSHQEIQCLEGTEEGARVGHEVKCYFCHSPSSSCLLSD